MEFKDYQIDEGAVKARLENILAQDFATLNRKDALRIILSVIDLTTLEGSDTNQKIKEMCYQARRFKVNGPDIPNVAAVCFYPPFAALAKSQLKETGIHVACVAGAFPSGQAPLDVRVAEVRYTAEQGADEIDMVISRGRFLEDDFQYIYDEVKAIKEACGKAHLKVILETGELQTSSNIRKASDIAIAAGADPATEGKNSIFNARLALFIGRDVHPGTPGIVVAIILHAVDDGAGMRRPLHQGQVRARPDNPGAADFTGVVFCLVDHAAIVDAVFAHLGQGRTCLRAPRSLEENSLTQTKY